LADISWEKLPADELVSNYAKGQEFDVINPSDAPASIPDF
jgi:hypothetical protein